MRKLAVITGASKGIGKAICQRAALEGLDLAICSRGKEALAALKAEIEASFPDIEVFAQSVDVSQKEQVLDFAESVKKLDKDLNLLVNNAGVFLPGQIKAEDDGHLEKQIETNLYSAYYLTRALLPALRKSKDSHIFNMCSTASIMPYVNGGSYCISKFAMLGFNKVLREEMKEEGIKVTAILPGATLTASWEGVELPQERFIRPEDVAEGVFSAYKMPKRSTVEELLIRPFEGDI